MVKKFYPVLLVGALIVSISGCKPSTEQYKRLTQAGIAYSNDVEKLIEVAGKTRIDSTSERILVACKQVSETCTNSYDSLSKEDASYLNALDLLRQQTRLLGRYFNVLGRLASFGDSPTVKTARDDAENIGKNLNTLGTAISTNPLVQEGLLSNVTQVFFSNSLQGVLGEELRLRKDTLKNAINYQEILLNILGNGMKKDVISLRAAQEQRIVKAQLLMRSAGNFNPDTWIKTRQEVLTLTQQTIEFDKASADELELRTAFKKLVGGNIKRQKINRVLNENNFSPVSLPVRDTNR